MNKNMRQQVYDKYAGHCVLNQADMKRYLKLNNHVWNRKPILDACCGGKMFYFAKDDPRVLFQDIREVETTLCDGRSFSVKPDVVADFTLMPYPDESFAMVVFDPPHLVYSRGKKSKTVDIYMERYRIKRLQPDISISNTARCTRIGATYSVRDFRSVSGC